MATLRAVAVIVITPVTGSLYSPVKEIFRLLDLIPDLWQIGQLQRGTIFFDYMNQWHPVKSQIAVKKIKTLLWKVKGLVNQIKVAVLH